MKMKYIGPRRDPFSLISGNIYECTGFQCEINGQFEDVRGPVHGKTTFVKIIDEEDEEYLYPMEWFEAVKE